VDALHVKLSERLPLLRAALVEARYPNQEVDELMRLFVGIFVLECFATADPQFDRSKVNKVLSAQIANGYSWYSAMKFLTGRRAREIFVQRTDLIREIGGSQMVYLFNVVLPTIGDVMEQVDNKAAKTQRQSPSIR
jgi:hypothetical protein